jgi:hypothetical protein
MVIVLAQVGIAAVPLADKYHMPTVAVVVKRCVITLEALCCLHACRQRRLVDSEIGIILHTMVITEGRKAQDAGRLNMVHRQAGRISINSRSPSA